MSDNPEDCNCDQALALEEDLRVAIEYGQACEDGLEKLSSILSRLIKFISINKRMTDSELEDHGFHKITEEELQNEQVFANLSDDIAH